MLDETGVAILPGSDFGRQPEELTARIAYVNFDGGKALRAAQNKYSDKALDEVFLNTYCPGVIKAASVIRDWISNL